MATSLVITSGKGGVGKSTTAANLGTALALMNKRVCMIDLDIGLRNLDVIMGLSNRIIYDIVDVASGRAQLHQALIKDKRFDDKLYLLPAAQNTVKNVLSPMDIVTIVNQLRPDFDYILLDCPAGIEQGFQNAIAGADGAIVICTPEIPSVSDADRVVGLLEQKQMKLAPRLIINRIIPGMMNAGDTMDIDEITKHLSIGLLGIVFEDDHVILASNKGVPVVMDPEDNASKGYRNIARRILGESVPLMTLKEHKPSFFERIFGRKKRRH
ncbi:septum site-determining protein MinD [Agrilactobacillus fermenti]|uniref:septum site-determining protein MinD n=1 Tax=Agrilactobacillus fermenti TaxID=2586909 RepID=UPI001E41FD57|nr:septum site-determining protein MinD [Agrilactobacillus fermenti]MCD2256486.1 septum site-determining protein MinD [Agrilactobacillus fermenti]